MRPFWFEDDNVRSVIINTERYVQMLSNGCWTALIRRRGVVRHLQWFQQDGATPHLKRIIGMATAAFSWRTDRVTRSGRCIYRTWTPHILNLRGYRKNRVYDNNPPTIRDLKSVITAAIKAIPREECGSVIEKFIWRIQMYLQHRVVHLEHIFERQLNKAFYGTDMQLWRCPLHRLNLI